MNTIFLDRDGVINRKRPWGDYVKSWEEFEFLPGARQAIRLLKQAGLRVIVVTNQRGVALGLMSKAQLREIHEHMQQELAAWGARCDAIYCCTHDRGECEYRKPLPGMLLHTREDYSDIDFSSSAMVGDSQTDLQAGAAAGCHLFLVEGNGQDGNLLVPAPECTGITIDGTGRSLLEIVVRYLLPSSGRRELCCREWGRITGPQAAYREM